METELTGIALATANAGQILTKSTGVSITLVIMLVGATIIVTGAYFETKNDISNLNRDVAEMKASISSILEEVQNKDQSMLEDAIHNVLFVEEFE